MNGGCTVYQTPICRSDTQAPALEGRLFALTLPIADRQLPANGYQPMSTAGLFRTSPH
jgi:hypothetical protein